MHKRKVIHISKQLKACNSKDGKVEKISPPILTELDVETVKKLIEPLQTSGEEEDEKEGSKSNSPSPRPSVSGLQSDSSTSSEPEETILKILVIGDSMAGKTSYVQRFVQNKFQPTYKNTVGVDFSTKNLSHKKYGGKPVKLQIWDIAGQDRYICLTRVYYQHADGCIIMFDLTSRKSFESVVQWKHDLDSKCILDNGAMLPCLLLAGKCDLPGRQVEMNEIETVCQQYGFMSWIEVSSKESLMIRDSMHFLVDRIICSKLSGIKPVRKSVICLSEEIRQGENPVHIPAGERVPSFCWC